MSSPDRSTAPEPARLPTPADPEPGPIPALARPRLLRHAALTTITAAPARTVAGPIAHDTSPDPAGFVRTSVRLPLDGPRLPMLAGRPLALPGPDAWRRASRWLAREPDPTDMPDRTCPEAQATPAVFLDVETNGLGHGAGAVAFVIGVAALEPDGVRVEQWLLQRLSAETAMLADFAARLAALRGGAPLGAPLVTFNGASFDLPLLRGRLRRHGLDPDVLGGGHLDLLPVARRLWQGRGPDCRLGTLERLQLGVERRGDIAGRDIPEVFWAYLRAPTDRRAGEALRQVCAHNVADMLAMPALGLTLARAVRSPGDLEGALRAADHLNAIGRRPPALAVLQPWLTPLTGPGPGSRDPRTALLERRALLRAADLLRRDGRADEAARCWEAVCQRFPGDPVAHAALAIHLERRVGDPARALAVAAASLAPCPRRLARLRRKSEGQAPDRVLQPRPSVIA